MAADRKKLKYKSKPSFTDDGINLVKISPVGVIIMSDIHIVNETISNQLNN